MKSKDLSGQKFTRWTVIEASSERVCNKKMWRCICECGTEGLIPTGNLNSGKSKSCGCLDREVAAKRMTRHGHAKGGSRSVENYTYNHMLSRCYNPLTRGYKNYGGRGIKVCDEWIGPDGFQNFLDHIGHRPEGDYSLDRINVNKDYEPGNVRWASYAVQARNRRLFESNKSGIAGVWFNDKTKKWLVTITVTYKKIHIKSTDDFFEACCARKSAEILYGDKNV
jgi:hypothetical protein